MSRALKVGLETNNPVLIILVIVAKLPAADEAVQLLTM
jgi:hypothetical protein